MACFLRGKRGTVLVWILGLVLGLILGIFAMLDTEYAQAKEGEKTEILPVVFYDEQERKVCVRQDAVLPLSEFLRMDIPLDYWPEGQRLFIKISLFTEEDREWMNTIHVERSVLHKTEK